MLTAKDSVQFWGEDDIVSYGNKIIFIRNPSYNPVGDWPGTAPSLDDLLHEAALARISYVQVSSDNSGVRRTVVILSGRVVITGTIFTDKEPWRLKLNNKNGIKFASNTLRARILGRSMRVKHNGVYCVSGDEFRRSYEETNSFWNSSDYCRKLVDLFDKGMPNKADAINDELLEDIQPLEESEEQVLDALQQFVEAEHDLEEQKARETAPFAYYACEAEARQVIYRQFFTLTLDQEDLDRLRELKPSLLRIEHPAEIVIMASVVNLSPSQDKPQILVSFEKQVNAEDIPRSGLLWLTALPTLKNVRSGVVELLRGRQSQNQWLVSVSAQNHDYRKLRPEILTLPKSKFPPNPSQVQAINAGAGTDDFLLVLGPPGTGKTTVILQWAEHFVSQGKRVLVTSQNNKAVDNVLERLAEKDSLECVRLGDETKVSSSMRDILIDNYAVTIQKKLVSDLEETIASLGPNKIYLDNLPPLLQKFNAVKTKIASLDERLTNVKTLEIPDNETKVSFLDVRIKHLGETLSNKRDEASKLFAIIARRESLHKVLQFFLKPFISKNRHMLENLRVEIQNIEEELSKNNQAIEDFKLLIHTLRNETDILTKELARLEEEGLSIFTLNPQPEGVLRSVMPLQIELGKHFNLQKATDAVWQQRAKYIKIESIVKEWQTLVTSERQQALYSLLLSFVDVVGATCIGINTNKAFKDTVFDVVIVDEAGQIQLHNLMVPLSRGPKAILVGDHKQLPPVVDSDLLDEVEERGSHYDKELLKKSWFELLWDQAPDDRKVMLDTQFRCPAIISNFISKAYYEDKYFAGVGMEKKVPLFSFFSSTLVFIDTSKLRDRFESKSDSNVTGNAKETEIVISILHRALQEQPTLKCGEIGVIVPYKNHAIEVRDSIRKHKKRGLLRSITTPLDELVATVDSFQGQERDLIIFPFSRSNKSGSVGFLKDWRRLNVAMTRTKKQLVMIGDLSTLTSPTKHREMDEMETAFKQSMLFLKEYTREHGHLIDASQWLNPSQPDRR